MAFIENTIGNTNSGGSIDQDNIDIFRYYYLGGRLSGNIVSTINNGQPFTINEQQSLWIETSSPIPNPNDTFSNLYVTRIYKLINLGKGIYGLGGNKTVTSNNLKLITQTQSTVEDVENLESTQIVDLGWNITGTNISDYVNTLTTPIAFQSQDDGYVLIKVINSGVEESYLFLGDGGTYGQGQLQTTLEDYQLIPGETSAGLQVGDNISLLNNDAGYITNEPVSATQSGIVNNISLQELGGVDKLVNGVRIGKGAGNVLTNTVFGREALGNNTTSSFTTAFGYRALRANTGLYNTAFGANALLANTTGYYNQAIGVFALSQNTTGYNNLVSGPNSAVTLLTGNNNTIYGFSAGNNMGSANSNNIYLGALAGFQTTGDNNIYITNSINASAGQTLFTGSNNLILAPNSGHATGMTTGNGVVILGKVAGIPATLTNNIFLSDGVGNIGLRKLEDGTMLFPNLTTALIDAEPTGKVAVTKEWITTQKGQANGYASLNSAGKIPNSQIPALAISETFLVNNQSEMLALVAEQGDVAIRTDLSKSFILRQEPATTLGNWSELLTPVSPVQSVNGLTGTVVLGKSEIGLGNVDNTSDLNKPISTATQTALNLKANDTDVLHKTGNETKTSGKLTIIGAFEASKIKLSSFSGGTGGTGGWIDMPVDGVSGIGDGGVGFNVWVAKAYEASQFFSNALAGDLAYRNTMGRLLFGTVADVNAQMVLSTSGLSTSQPISTQNATASNHAAALGQVQTEIATVPDTTVALVVANLSKYYSLTGSGATASLPPITGNVGKTITLVNKSGTIQNLFSNDSVSNDIWIMGTVTNTFSMPIGNIMTLFNDGVNWVIK